MNKKQEDTFLRLKFSEIMAKEKLISNVNLFKIMQIQREGNKSFIGQIAIEQGMIRESQLAFIFEKYFKISSITLSAQQLSEQLIQLFPLDILKKYHILPIELKENILTLAMANPLEVDAIEQIRAFVPYEILPVYCGEGTLSKKIEEYALKAQRANVREEELVALNPQEAVRFFENKSKSTTESKEELVALNPQEAVRFFENKSKSTTESKEELVALNPQEAVRFFENKSHTSSSAIPEPKKVILPETATDKKLVALNPSEALRFLDGEIQKKKEQTRVLEKQKLESSQKKSEVEEIIEVKPVQTSSRPKTQRMSPSPSSKSLLNEEIPILPSPEGVFSSQREEEDENAQRISSPKIKPMNLKGENIRPPQEILPSLPSSPSTGGVLKPMTVKLSTSDRLKPMPTRSAPAPLPHKMTKTDHLVPVPLKKSSENLLRRELKTVTRPHFYSPVSVEVVSLTEKEFQRFFSVTPSLLLEHWADFCQDYEKNCPGFPLTSQEFELLRF
jgi:hypothetical protein